MIGLPLNFKNGLLVALLAGMCLSLAFYHERLKIVTNERDLAQVQLKVVGQQLAEQNTAIKQWRQQAQLQAKKLQQAEEVSAQQATLEQQHIKKLLDSHVSAN